MQSIQKEKNMKGKKEEDKFVWNRCSSLEREKTRI